MIAFTVLASLALVGVGAQASCDDSWKEIRTAPIGCNICGQSADKCATKAGCNVIDPGQGQGEWSCNYLQQTVQDVTYDGNDGERSFCARAQLKATQGGCCQEKVTDGCDLRGPAIDLNGICNICGAGNEVHPSMADTMIRGTDLGSHLCSSFEMLGERKVLRASNCLKVQEQAISCCYAKYVPTCGEPTEGGAVYSCNSPKVFDTSKTATTSPSNANCCKDGDSDASPPSSGWKMKQDYRFVGGRMFTTSGRSTYTILMPDSDLEACKARCEELSGCNGFDQSSGRCWFKDSATLEPVNVAWNKKAHYMGPVSLSSVMGTVRNPEEAGALSPSSTSAATGRDISLTGLGLFSFLLLA